MTETAGAGVSTASSIGIALIVRDDTTGLQRILEQLSSLTCSESGRPIFDEIVVLGQEDTPQETIDAALAFPRVLLSTDYVWIDDFGDKRRKSFALLSTDWQGWCDTDDAWQGLENLRTIIGKLEQQAPQVDAIWCKYYYDKHAASGQSIAEHDRERFVKKGSPWHWKDPQEVHEHMVVPEGEPIKMVFAPSMSVTHARDTSRDAERNRRNIRILRKAMKKRPKDARIYFDLGSQYYHGSRWMRALASYNHFLKLHEGPVERYQAFHRMADCCRILASGGQQRLILRAEEYERAAVKLIPNWRDAWYGLAECSMFRGDWTMVLNYAAMADRERFGKYAPTALDKPNPLLVLNSLDYSLHADIPVHRALGAMGRTDEALEVVERAIAIVPQHEELIQAKQVYGNLAYEKRATQAALDLAAVIPDDAQKMALWEQLPDGVKKKKETRDVLVAPALLKARDGADVAIWCGPSLDDWGPSTPNETGIGGSETAVIEMAWHLARHGLNVDVYNQCGKNEGKLGSSLRYLDFSRFDPAKPTKLFVGWRNYDIIRSGPKADQKWFWCHDLHVGEGFTAAHAALYDLIRPVSQWHGEHLLWLYPFIAGKIAPTRNGLTLDRFARADLPRLPHRMIWTSSPDRGLEHLFAIWPEVRKRFGDAELHVFYGWDNIDKVIQQNQDANLLAFKNQMLALGKQPGIVWRGRVNQTVLAEEFLQAAVLPYTSHYLETNCISAAEAMAAGCVVQATISGAIPETTAGAAILVRGHPASQAYRTVFLRNLLALLDNAEVRAEWAAKGKVRAGQLRWEDVAAEWVARLQGQVMDTVAGNGAQPAYTMGATTQMTTVAA